ncbi:MAG: glutamate synthase subunit beta [Cyclobacteriaceae bacterium]|nr:glutamate synthase subunit beta [Cyclobacteriaceae bacterium]
MGNPRGFIEIKRKDAGNRPIKERITDFGEVEQTLNTDDRILQASRCMDCGVPFCHWACPVNSKIPEWQDAVYQKDWEEAAKILHSTNDFPEFTGRVCPAPCEKSCVLAIHDEAVTIRENEAATIERAFEKGFIKPIMPKIKTGKKVAVIGSGPAGMSIAARLNRLGHTVTLFEKDEAIGGLLRFGIPDFKLNKGIIDRRVKVLEEEGLIIKTNTFIGKDITAEKLLKDFDAVCLAVGAMKPLDLEVPGRELKGVHFAMEYLTQQNRKVAGAEFSPEERINAEGKNVIVIGGGDTGSDCVGTAIRQKAKSVRQIEIMPKPPVKRSNGNPWPYWPQTLKTSSSHEEGCDRFWSLETKKLSGIDGVVNSIELQEVKWESANGNGQLKKSVTSKKGVTFDADLVLLAMGFTQPIHEGLLNDLKLDYDSRGNVVINDKFQTSNSKVFAVGDTVLGASLVVKALASGRDAAGHVHEFLLNDK